MERITRANALVAGLSLAALLVPGAVRAAGARTLEPILGYDKWLDVRPTAESLRGRVVLVDVFTFGCYNCQNVTPNLRALHRTKSGSQFTIVGIHTPETPYERDRANVVANLKRQGIVWPVAVDNDNKLWDAYGIEYWPTQLIFDRNGKLQRIVEGDSQDELVDRTVAQLMA